MTGVADAMLYSVLPMVLLLEIALEGFIDGVEEALGIIEEEVNEVVEPVELPGELFADVAKVGSVPGIVSFSV